MSKKNAAPIANPKLTPDKIEDNASNVDNNSAKGQPVQSNKPQNLNRKSNVAVKKPNGFVRFFKKIGNAFKDMWSERKNVTWPTAAKVMASTGVVLLVVGIFFAVLMGFNSLFTYILDLIINL